MPNWKKVITSGSDAALNSLNVTDTATYNTVEFINSNIMKFNQRYTGGANGTYFTSNEYQKVVTIVPSGNSQNYQVVGRITAQNAGETHTIYFNAALRSNTLPDLNWTINYDEEYNGGRYVDPQLWVKETTTAGFIVAFKTLATIYGTVTIDFDVIPRAASQKANITINQVADSEQTSIDSGYTAYDMQRNVRNQNGNLTISGSVTADSFSGDGSNLTGLGDSAFQDTGSMTVLNADSADTATTANNVSIRTVTTTGEYDILYTDDGNRVSRDTSGHFIYNPDSNILSVDNIIVTELTSSGLQVAGIDYPTSDGSNGQVLTTNGSGQLSFNTTTGGIFAQTGSIYATTNELEVTGSLVIDQSSNGQAIEILNADSRWKQYIDSNGHITLNASGSGNNTNVNYTLEKGNFQVNLKEGHFNLDIDNTSKDFRIRDSGNVTYFVVTGDKKVGIGEAVGVTPGQDVDIAGTVRIRDYGTGGKTGTLAYTLGVDSNGDLIEYTAAADTTIYSTNGALSSNRTVTGNSNSLNFANLSSFSVTNSNISLEAGDAIYLLSLPSATGSALDNTLYIDTVSGEVKYGASNTSTGTVDTSGTPLDNQVAVFTDSDTIEGHSKLTYDSSTEQLTVTKAKASTSLAVGGLTPSATVGRIDAANDIIAYSTSDQRLKENVVPIKNALKKVHQIRGVEFDWKEITEEEREVVHGNTGHDIGVLAQEIEQILPEAVQTRESGYKAVRYEKIVPLLIQAINELQEKLDGLTK